MAFLEGMYNPWVLALLILLLSGSEAIRPKDSEAIRPKDNPRRLNDGVPPPVPNNMTVNCSTTSASPSVAQIARGITFLDGYVGFEAPPTGTVCENKKAPDCTQTYATGNHQPDNGSILYICGGPQEDNMWASPTCKQLADSFRLLSNSCQLLDTTANPPVMRAGGQVFVSQIDDMVAGIQSYYGTVAQDVGQEEKGGMK